MACPCGCNARIRFLDRGAAKQYPEVVGALGLLREVQADLKSDGVADARLDPLLRQGESIQRNLIAYLHREARPGTHPDMLAVARELQQWNAGWQAFLTQLMAETAR